MNLEELKKEAVEHRHNYGIDSADVKMFIDRAYSLGKEEGREEFNKREFKAGLTRAAEIARTVIVNMDGKIHIKAKDEFLVTGLRGAIATAIEAERESL